MCQNAAGQKHGLCFWGTSVVFIPSHNRICTVCECVIRLPLFSLSSIVLLFPQAFVCFQVLMVTFSSSPNTGYKMLSSLSSKKSDYKYSHIRSWIILFSGFILQGVIQLYPVWFEPVCSCRVSWRALLSSSLPSCPLMGAYIRSQSCAVLHVSPHKCTSTLPSRHSSSPSSLLPKRIAFQ